MLQCIKLAVGRVIVREYVIFTKQRKFLSKLLNIKTFMTNALEFDILRENQARDIIKKDLCALTKNLILFYPKKKKNLYY